MKKLTVLFSIIAASFFANGQNTYTTIEANNVRAHVVSAGLLFNNLGNASSGFEAPKNDDPSKESLTTIYASSLWLGGIDAGANRYVAVQTYRQAGIDYKPGPIDAFSASPSDFDKLWRITKTDIDSFKLGTITQNVKNWPGNYQTVNGSAVLAPFVDDDNNGIYEPEKGDYPLFNGDEALFFIYNDDTLHTESNSRPLFFEIKGMVYQYKSIGNNFLDNSVFVDYWITNKSNRTYNYVNAGIWTDFDLGDFADDRIGCSPTKNLYYGYNANDIDTKYGTQVPAMAIRVLNQPLYSFVQPNAGFGISFPSIDSQYFNFMNGRFGDGVSMTDKGSGYKTGGNQTRFMFNGDPCTNTGWTEENAGMAVSDRRALGSIRFDNFAPNQQKRFSVAYTYARATGAINSLCRAIDQSDSLQTWFNQQPALSVPAIESSNVKIYPNPATQKVFIEASGITDKLEVNLFDVSGKLLLSSNSPTIDISALAKGLYIVRGKIGTQYFSKKLQVK